MKPHIACVFIIIIAIIISAPTLWLLEFQIKYPLFCFEILFIVLLTAKYLGRPGLSFTWNIRIPLNVVDFSFLLVSICILVSMIFESETLANPFLAVLSTSFLPGYVVLRATSLFSRFSNIERVVLSYTLSLPITCFFSSILLLIPDAHGSKGLIICLFYVLLSLLPIIISRRSRVSEEKTPEQSHDLVDVVSLISLFSFFLLWIAFFYPQMATLPRLDIVRHYAVAKTVGEMPEFVSSPYPWFAIYESTLYALSRSSMMAFQTSLACLSIVVIFSFYVMSKAYLKSIDTRLPIIATLCWSTFSGFGWVFFSISKLTMTNLSQAALLSQADQISYWDIQYGGSLNLWLWFRPITIGFTVFFLLLYLLKRFDIPKRRFVVLFSLLLTTLALFHVHELILFVAFTTGLAILYPKIRLRLQEATFATTFGILGMVIVCGLLIFGTGMSIQIPTYALVGLLLLNAVTYFFLLSRWNGCSQNTLFRVARLAGVCFLVVSVGGLLTGMLLDDAFSPSTHAQSIYEILFVPWYLYPVLLGMAGLLCLIFLSTMTRLKGLGNETTIAFVCLSLIVLVIGRGVSLVNMYFFQVEFYERRSIQYLIVAAVMMAFSLLIAREARTRASLVRIERPVPKTTIPTKTKNRVRASGISWKLRDKRILIYSLSISLLVLGGISSTFLSADFWGNALYSGCLDETELSAMEFLSSTLKENPRSPVLTITERSMAALDFAGVQRMLNPFNYVHVPVWSSSEQELALTALLSWKSPFTYTYIYLHQRDINVLQAVFGTGYIYNHLLRYIPEIFSNSMTSIYRMPAGAPPSLQSETVLVMPFNSSTNNNLLFAYDILSLGKCNYTTKIDYDKQILKSRFIVLPSDRSMIFMSDAIDWLEDQRKTLVVLNTDGYGPLAHLFFSRKVPEEYIKASGVIGANHSIWLHTSVKVEQMEINDGVQILGWYNNSNQSTPYAASYKIGEGQIVYVNVYPIIEGLISSSGQEARSLHSVLAHLLSIIDLNLPTYDMNSVPWMWDDNVPLVIYGSAAISGDVVASSSSIFFNNSGMLLKRLEIADGSKHSVLWDVGSITPRDFSEATIYVNDVTPGGTMFYSRLNMNSSTIVLEGEELSVSISFLNGSNTDIRSEGALELTLEGQCQVFMFQPKITCVGEIVFEKAYAIHEGVNHLRTLGETLRVEGEMEFDLPFSGSYGIAKDFIFQGSYNRDPPILQWDELHSFRESLQWIGVSAFLIVPILIKKRSKQTAKVPYNQASIEESVTE